MGRYIMVSDPQSTVISLMVSVDVKHHVYLLTVNSHSFQGAIFWGKNISIIIYYALIFLYQLAYLTMSCVLDGVYV